ncbi:hypothetical protein HELRODRAFT_103786 [Helobdella robusta]|uniref:non-specific serine/threonine protein kinase n=1 Tax=Helobdella robusta TaxID=6412 RepID=T1EDH5_HELRO|nr:hypothetical protein HELRODRAFT_103786 [Helobdella robusta]ESN92307.1 hypothetical protein HELRODRAFT_103786 [Helobdella robusta]
MDTTEEQMDLEIINLSPGKDEVVVAIPDSTELQEAVGGSKVESNEFIVGRTIKTRVLNKINGGSYGDIHLGVLLDTSETVAVKLESMKSPHQQLLQEGNVMRHLEGGPGIPKVHWFGSYEPLYNVMVMDYLGLSLQELFSFCGHIFTLKTVLLIGEQVLDILDFIHSKEYVHRDIKPDNFVIGALGSSKQDTVFLIDFGLAKKCQRQRFSVGGGFSSGYGINRPMVGTVRYMGLHAHDGQGDQPRDDLESLGYCFLYFLKGRLPWQGVKGFKNREEKLAEIRKIKASTPIDSLCGGLPSLFGDFISKCRRAKKNDPNVTAAKWKRYLTFLAEERKIAFDRVYDWSNKPELLDFKADSRKHGHDSS